MITPTNFDTGSRICYFTTFHEVNGLYESWWEEVRYATDAAEANVISSQVYGSDKHKPVIDIDVPIRVYPSSTLGHFHLYIDMEMPWRAYKRLLRALVRAGLVEPGYYAATKKRGSSFVRLPWIHKDPSPGGELK